MILVFGSTGQVGRELARRGDVLLLGRDAADLSNPAGCAAKIQELRPDFVINAAAYTAVDRAEEEEGQAHIVNAEAPGAMARVCAASGIGFLHISTDYVFDGSGDMPWKVSDKTGPIGAYGRTKLAGESAVVSAGGDYGILRTSWVFSAHGSNFVTTMLRLGAERGELSVVADQIGGPTAAHDIAETLLKMADQFMAGGGTNGVFHFSGKPNVSWADFAREIFTQAGLSVTVTDIPAANYPTPAARPANSRLDCSLLQQEFAISQPDWRLSLADILEDLS